MLADLGQGIVDRTNWLWGSTNFKRGIHDRAHCFVPSQCVSLNDFTG